MQIDCHYIEEGDTTDAHLHHLHNHVDNHRPTDEEHIGHYCNGSYLGNKTLVMVMKLMMLVMVVAMVMVVVVAVVKMMVVMIVNMTMITMIKKDEQQVKEFYT